MQIVPRDCMITLLIIFILCAIRFVVVKEKRIAFLTATVFLSYIMVVIFSLTGISPISGFHEDIYWKSVQFIPFKTITNMISSGMDLYVFENIFGNILMFVPLGFLLPVLSDKMHAWYYTILAGAFVSFCIESSQLFLARGTDIDDVILNTCGVVLGYIGYTIINHFLSNWITSFRAKICYDKCLIISAIIVPYMVVVICGFYDRSMFFHGGLA